MDNKQDIKQDIKKQPTRVALVGLGGHGYTIQQACEDASNIHVVSVYDPNRREADEAAHRFSSRVAPSYEALIQDEDVEAVCLVTPNHLHLEQVVTALEAGKSVFVEKPIANTVSDGLVMVELAESKGLVLMIGHNMRFSYAARKAKEWIQAGRLGDIVSTEIHFSSDSAFGLHEDSWRNQPDLCPLLPVMQLAVHAFDLIHYLVGRIEEVTAVARSVVTRPGVVDSVASSFRLEGGGLGTMVSNYCTPLLFEYRIAGTEGLLQCTFDRFSYRSRDGKVEEVNDYSDLTQDSYTKQMAAFGDAVRNFSVPETDGWVGLQALAVVEAMHVSSLSKEPQAVQLFESQSLTTSS